MLWVNLAMFDIPETPKTLFITGQNDPVLGFRFNSLIS